MVTLATIGVSGAVAVSTSAIATDTISGACSSVDVLMSSVVKGELSLDDVVRHRKLVSGHRDSATALCVGDFLSGAEGDAVEIGMTEGGPIEIDPVETGVGEICLSQVGFDDVCIVKPSGPQVCPFQLGLAQIRATQVSPLKAGIIKLHLREIHPPQCRLVKVCAFRERLSQYRLRHRRRDWRAKFGGLARCWTAQRESRKC